MRRKYLIRGAIALLIIAVIVAAVVFAVCQSSPAPEPPDPSVDLPVFEIEELPEPVPEPEPEPEPEEPEPEEPEPEEPPREPLTSLPAVMRIPALSLDYEIKSMGADANGTMMVANGREIITWFDRSAIPGNEGNAIFGGHNLWRGVRSQIYNLDELEIGDELEIAYEDGTSIKFFLESVFVYELRLAPANLIMDTGGEARLTLITCKPPFNSARGTSDNRIVAIFKEEGVYVFPDPPVEKFPPRDPPLY